MRRALAGCLVLALAAPAGAQAPVVSDPDVREGIRQVEEGDYDAAILTLDNAARRLSADPARTRELSQAYLYLGVAYVGKGHEAAAKAKFREAVTQLREMTLSPDKFPPKVIDLFEAAREEVAKAPAPQPSVAPSPAAKGGGGGGKKWLIIGGVTAAAAGGAAIALGQKEDDGCDTVFADRSGPLSLPNDASVDVTGGPAVEAGVWFAELTWTGPAGSDVNLRAVDNQGFTILDGGLIGANTKKAEWNGQPGVVYTARATLIHGGPVTFELSIGGPCVNTP
jgi:hypothetical protein